MEGSTSYLYAHPRLHSRDGEAVREFLLGKHLEFEIIGRAASHAPVDTHINALYMPDGSYLSYVQYGAPSSTASCCASASRLNTAITRLQSALRRRPCGRSGEVTTALLPAQA